MVGKDSLLWLLYSGKIRKIAASNQSTINAVPSDQPTTSKTVEKTQQNPVNISKGGPVSTDDSASESDGSEVEEYENRLPPEEDIIWDAVGTYNLKQFDCTAPGGIRVSDEVRNNYREGTPYDFYKIFLSNDMLQLIVEETNRYAQQMKTSENLPPKSRINKWVDTDDKQIEKLMGIIMWMGLVKLPQLKDYWSKNSLYENTIKKVMSRNRFELLLRMLHFNNNDTAVPGDRLHKIAPLMNKLLESSQSAVEPGEKFCIDETLVPFRGRLAFKQYIKNKRHKFGIKLFKLCLEQGYTYNLSIYCGKEENKDKTISVPTKVVLSLSDNLLDSGRKLYTDNYYTSVSIAHQLLSRKTHLIGTLRANRKHNPKDVTSKKLKQGEHISRQSNTGCTVLKWRDKREILVLSTTHDDRMVSIVRRNE